MCIQLIQTKAFFSALPTSKLPVRGSKGERYWQKQTIRQLPAHDIDVVYCTDLDRVETQQMEMLIKKRRETALGRAIVRQREAGDDSMEWVSPCVCPWTISMTWWNG